MGSPLNYQRNFNNCGNEIQIKAAVLVSGVQKGKAVLKRLRSFAWDELQIRGQQELRKRWDLLHFWLNLEFTTTLGSSPLVSGAPHFFFSPADLQGLIAEL